MGTVRHFFLLALLLVLGACTLRGMIDSVTPAKDRAFAHEMVSRLRSGDRPWLQKHFAPELWANSNAEIGAVPSLFPAEGGTTELISFEMSTNMVNGRTERSRDFTLVTQGGGRWTVTGFGTYSDGGPDLVVRWSVAPHDSIPPELAMMEAMERVLPWVWAGLAAILVGGGVLIIWLVRRSRRRHDPWAGGSGGGL